MDLYRLLLWGLLCYQVAASVDFAPSPVVTPSAALATSASSTPSSHLGEGHGEGSFANKQNDLGRGSANGLGSSNEEHALTKISDSSNDYTAADQLNEQEINFDIVMGGTFLYSSKEDGEGGGDKELNNNGVNGKGVLLYPDEFTSDGLKTLGEVVAEASRVDSWYDVSGQRVESRRKREASERVPGAWKDFRALVRARIISVLDGRTLEEVINDRDAMKRLMPLLRLLRGRGKPARDRVGAAGEEGAEENRSIGGEPSPSGPGLEGVTVMAEENSSAGVDYDTRAQVSSENRSVGDEPSPSGPGLEGVTVMAEENSSAGVDYDTRAQVSSENRSVGDEPSPSGGSREDKGVDDKKVNISRTVGLEATQVKNVSDVKYMDQGVNETSSKETGDVFPSVGIRDEQGDTNTTSVLEEGVGGNYSHSTGSESEMRAEESTGHGDISEGGVKDGGQHPNKSDADEMVSHSKEETHHKRKRVRKIIKRKKKSERNHADALNTGQTVLTTDNVASSGNIEEGLKTDGPIVSLGLENATKPILNSSLYVDQAVNSSVLGEESKLHAASVDKDVIGSEKNQGESMNGTMIDNVLHIEANVGKEVNTDGIPEINVHSVKHRKKKIKHKHIRQPEHTHRKVNESEVNDTLETKGDKSLGSLLGEVLKSVSIYEVHGNVGQINIKTDGVTKTLDGGLKDDENMGNYSGETNTTLKWNNNDNSESNKSKEQNLNQTTEKTGDHVIDHIAQRNYSSDVLETFKQIPTTTQPRGNRGNSLWMKPYFQLLGYTKQESTVISASNQTDKTMSSQVHENTTNALADDQDSSGKKIFEDKLSEYVEQDTSMKKHKQEDHTAEDVPRSGDDTEFQAKKSDSNKLNSVNVEDKDSNHDESNISDDDTDAEVKGDDREETRRNSESGVDNDEDDKEDRKNEPSNDTHESDNGNYNSSEHDTEAKVNGNDDKKGNYTTNDESSSSGIIGPAIKEGNKKRVMRVKRIRHRDSPINETNFQNGLKVRKFRNGTLVETGVNGTRLYRGVKKIKRHRTSNTTRVPINLIDSIDQDDTSVNDTDNDDGEASFKQTSGTLEHHDETQAGEEAIPMSTSQHHSVDAVGNKSTRAVNKDNHQNIKLEQMHLVTDSASTNIGTSIYNTNKICILICLKILMVFNVIS